MTIYQKVLKNEEYLQTVIEIEKLKFISNGKWDWEHGLGHFKRVSSYIEKILKYLSADKRTIDLGMTAGLLHDIGLLQGTKSNHDLEGSKNFKKYLNKTDVTNKEIGIIEQAILAHSEGNEIKSQIGMALLLADKLDVTYHRTKNSSIKDEINTEFQKIKKVDIMITKSNLVLKYATDEDFNINILSNWKKTITIPIKVSEYLNREFIFIVNGKTIDLNSILSD